MKNKIILNLINLICLSLGFYMAKYLNQSSFYQKNGEGIFVYFAGALIVSVLLIFIKNKNYKIITNYSLILSCLALLLIYISPETGDPYLQIQKKTVALFMALILIISSFSLAIYKSLKNSNNK